MRVLLSTIFFPPGQTGGTESYTLGLAHALQAMGHEPFVICAEGWGEGPSAYVTYRDEPYEGIPVRRLHFNWEQARDPFTNLYDNQEVERHFASYLEAVQPNVIHATSCYTLGGGVFHAARRVGVRSVLTLTDFWFLSSRPTLLRGDGSLCEGPRSPVECQRCLAWNSKAHSLFALPLPADAVSRALQLVGRVPRIARLRGFRGYVGDVPKRARYLRQVFDDIDLVIGPSQFLIDMFVRNGYPRERFRLSRHGLDTSWLPEVRPRPSGSPLSIGYTGVIEPIKGVDILIRAFRRVSSSPDTALRIYGDLGKNPAYGQELQRLAAGDPRIRFEGGYQRSRLADVLSGLDVVVVPSVVYENAPLAIGEALAARRPVIATNLGSMPELVLHERNGLVFERGDVAGLAATLQRVLDDPSLLDTLRRGIAPVRTIQDEAEDIVRMYREFARPVEFAAASS